MCGWRAMPRKACGEEDKVADLHRRATEALQTFRRNDIELVIKSRLSTFEHRGTKLQSQGLSEEQFKEAASRHTRSMRRRRSRRRRRTSSTARGTTLRTTTRTRLACRPTRSRLVSRRSKTCPWRRFATKSRRSWLQGGVELGPWHSLRPWLRMTRRHLLSNHFKKTTVGQ